MDTDGPRVGAAEPTSATVSEAKETPRQPNKHRLEAAVRLASKLNAGSKSNTVAAIIRGLPKA
jgi:hypothetical protein